MEEIVEIDRPIDIDGREVPAGSMMLCEPCEDGRHHFEAGGSCWRVVLVYCVSG